MQKYLLNLFFVLLLTSFIATESFSQCDPGFTPVSFTAYWGPNQEPVTISFCYACTIGPAGVNISNVSITTSGLPTENFNDAFDATNHFTGTFSSWLTQQMLNKFYEFCQIPPCFQPPLDPCGNVLETIAENPVCGKLIIFPKFQDNNGDWHYPQTFEMCSTELGYCQIKIKNCRDYDHGGVIRSCSCEVVFSNVNCPPNMQVLPPDAWDVGYTSECFQMNPYCGCPTE